MEVAAVALEIDDWIADELTRTVEGDVATALDLEQLDPTLLEVLGRGEHVGALR
jgi:hypothetical protein